jgi:hypothetical protein
LFSVVKAREIARRLVFGVVAGLTIGVIDLWVFELSWRGFLAGLAAGVAYCVPLAFLLAPGMRRFPLVLVGVAVLAGSIGGTVWWLVARAGQMWIAMAVGSVGALAQFAGEGLFSRRSR